MFSVKNKPKNTRPVVITSVSFEHVSPKESRRVDLYRTISGSHTGQEQDPSKWIKIASMKVPRQKFHYSDFILDTPITLQAGETVGLYIKAGENIILVNKQKKKTKLFDERVALAYGAAIMNEVFGTIAGKYTMNGVVTYSTALA